LEQYVTDYKQGVDLSKQTLNKSVETKKHKNGLARFKDSETLLKEV